jgi:hypothetical protein
VPEFSTTEDVNRWLATQSPEASVVFAARAALRVVPVFKVASRDQLKGALRMFRCAASAWTVAAYPGYRDRLVSAALNAFNTVDPNAHGLQRCESAAISAAAAASHRADVISFASAAVSSAIDATALYGRKSLCRRGPRCSLERRPDVRQHVHPTTS